MHVLDHSEKVGRSPDRFGNQKAKVSSLRDFGHFPDHANDVWTVAGQCRHLADVRRRGYMVRLIRKGGRHATVARADSSCSCRCPHGLPPTRFTAGSLCTSRCAKTRLSASLLLRRSWSANATVRGLSLTWGRRLHHSSSLLSLQRRHPSAVDVHEPRQVVW